MLQERRAVPEPIYSCSMRDALQALLRQASDAKRSADFWRAAAAILSEWAGGARLSIRYQGINESGSVSAGTDDRSGKNLAAEWRDPDGRHVEANLAGAPPSLPASELEAAIEFASRLAVMVGRRAALERERRLGTFVVELARWLLAAPETQLLLRYTLQSLMELVEAQGAFVALKQPDGENLRISPALGEAGPVEGLVVGLGNSATGKVARIGFGAHHRRSARRTRFEPHRDVTHRGRPRRSHRAAPHFPGDGGRGGLA